MARVLDPQSHALKRDAFLESAQRLILTKGYEQMSIQDCLDDLGVSKGAFYHYFDSKTALLDAVAERWVTETMAAIEPIISDAALTAPEKFTALFRALSRWKSERKELLLAVIEAWYSDDNLVVREKFRRGQIARMEPLLLSIIEQGQAEGTFSVGSPAGAARVLISLLQGANETAAALYFARRDGVISLEEVEVRLNAYWDAFERLLGAPPGSLCIVDPSVIREWFG